MGSLSRAARRAVAVVALLALAGCASIVTLNRDSWRWQSMSVSSYGERGADFTRYRTYNWSPAGALVTGDARLDNNPIFYERVQANVEKQLAMRGFEKATLERPDLQIYCHASVSQRVDANGVDPYVDEVGTLMIYFLDVRTKTVVWRGWAEGSVDGAIDNQRWMERAIDDAVTRILQRLPRRL